MNEAKHRAQTQHEKRRRSGLLTATAAAAVYLTTALHADLLVCASISTPTRKMQLHWIHLRKSATFE